MSELQVHVCCNDNSFSVCADGDTVGGLHRKVASVTGVPVRVFVLHFEGRRLEGVGVGAGQLLQSLGVTHGARLSMTMLEALQVTVAELGGSGAARIAAALELRPELPLVVDVSGAHGKLVMPRLPRCVQHLWFSRVKPGKGIVTELTGEQGFFLYNERSLVSVDLTCLLVGAVGDRFLCGCTSLTSVDLPGVFAAGDLFLAGCSSLTFIDLAPLSSLMRVGDYFLHSCSNLKTINLTPLADLISIGVLGFLQQCPSLHTLRVPKNSYIAVRVTSSGPRCRVIVSHDT